MTRDEATIEAERRQRVHPDAKWIATRRGEEWIVARIGLAPASTQPLSTALTPPPPAPREDPQSQLQRLIQQVGLPT
jgi:hypothetical protein